MEFNYIQINVQLCVNKINYAVVLKYEMGIFWQNGVKCAISGRKGAKWSIFGRNGHVK